ncbi:hypothetical protein [Paraclostridium bifermentans]|uniref:hypothetical protein n=1 Tax=Paraclostridium bifermentans TaxID=1490 RepID=UPI00374F4042
MYKSTVVDLNMGSETQAEFKVDKFPSLVIKNLQFDWEIEYFKNKRYREKYALPLFIENNGDYFEIGKMELTTSNLVAFNFVGEGQYIVELHKSKDSVKIIDYNDGDTLIKLMELE